MKILTLQTILIVATLVQSCVAADLQSESGSFLPVEKTFMCGVRLATGYILGGKIAKRGEFPFIAALGYKSSQGMKNIVTWGQFHHVNLLLAQIAKAQKYSQEVSYFLHFWDLRS
jgi:hypothetical protein